MAGKNVYEIITDRIVDELEKGNIPWHRPWVCYSRNAKTYRFGALAVSHTNGKPYSLLNQMLLGKPGEYLTWNQVQKEGGKVKKGAKSGMVCFWKMLPIEEEDANGKPVLDPKTGKPVKKVIPFLRYYNVFHLDDVDGIKEKYPQSKEDHTVTVEMEKAGIHEEAERVLHGYIDREGITFKESLSNEAYYSPALDLIQLPLRSQFEKTAEYYSTAFHEATHSTGHESRLNRLKLTGKSAAFGGSDYSKEELVAELGAASICHALGIETESSFKNSVAYVQSWLKALKNDKRMIVGAASKAEKAVDLIFGHVDTAEQEEGEELPF